MSEITCEHGHSIFSLYGETCKNVVTHFYSIAMDHELTVMTARCEEHALLKNTHIKTTQLYTLTEITESEYNVFKVMNE